MKWLIFAQGGIGPPAAYPVLFQGALRRHEASEEIRGRAAEEITLRRMPPPRRRFTKLEALRAIEKSPLRFTHSWDQVKEETRG